MGVVAKKDMPMNTYILELCGVLSSDPLPQNMPHLSVMERKKGRKAFKALMAGPLRFVNHHCSHNAVVSLLLQIVHASS